MSLAQTPPQSGPHRGAGWALLAVSCALQTSAVLLMKAANVYVGGTFLQRALSPLFASAIAAMGLQFFVWRKVLASLPLSIAYPVTAIVVPLNLAGGVLFYGERLSAGETFGGFVVAVGVALLTRSQADGTPEPSAGP